MSQRLLKLKPQCSLQVYFWVQNSNTWRGTGKAHFPGISQMICLKTISPPVVGALTFNCDLTVKNLVAVVSAQQLEHACSLRPSGSSEVSLCPWEGAGLDEFMEVVFSIVEFIDQKPTLVGVHSRDCGCRRLHNFSFRYLFVCLFIERRKEKIHLLVSKCSKALSCLTVYFKMPMIVLVLLQVRD